MGETFLGSGPVSRLAALGPFLIMMGVFVSKAESSALGVTTDFWSGFLLAVGVAASAVWIALTVRQLIEGRPR